MPKVSDEARRTTRGWLLRVANHTGKSLAALADEAGVARSTLYRAVDEANPHVPSTVTIAKISALTGFPPPDSYGNGGSRPGFSEAEAEPFRFDEASPELDGLVRQFIGGRPGVDPWVLKTRALELAGYLPGDVVIVDLNARPHRGDVVVAQVYDFSHERAQTIWRLYEPPSLVAASADRGLMQAYRDDAQIKGVVLAMVRPRRPGEE